MNKASQSASGTPYTLIDQAVKALSEPPPELRRALKPLPPKGRNLAQQQADFTAEGSPPPARTVTPESTQAQTPASAARRP